MDDDANEEENTTKMSVPAPFNDAEYEEFVKEVLHEPWEASRDADTLHDISIVHPENNREILIDSARNRISYRNCDSGMWGLQQQQVSDLDGAADKLMTVALNVPMTEMHYLGIDGHPEPQSEAGNTYEDYDESLDNSKTEV